MPILPRLLPRRAARVAAALLLALVAPLAAARADGLTLRRVMLSAAGVGYFEYAAEVTGNAELGLDVPLGQVDDVLASLVVFDADGRVAGVSLPGADGEAAAFAGVPFGPPALDSALAYLNALQGVEISVQGPRPMTGRLLRAEPEPMGEKRPPRTRVTLLTAQGLQQFVLEEAEGVQVADPALRTRIDAALAALRGQAAQEVRHLTLRTEGTGARSLRVAYVAGAPLWKTTYRLVLPDATGDKARLQAWAVFENVSGTDWNGVELALQYGNPVTFRQALYRTYFVERPQVPVEVLGRILPDVDTGAHPVAAAPAPAPSGAPATLAFRKSAAPMAPAMAEPASAAATTEAAESTVFRLPGPVVLGAGQTATLPILDRSVPASRVWLVQAGRPHPLAAVRLVNDTGASLPAGVLTLYDLGADAAFAGNARLGGVPTGGSRLLAFAEDLRTGVDWRTARATTLASLTAAAGVLHIQRRERTTLRITLTAPPTESRVLLLEIPRRDDSTLVAEGAFKPSEETAAVWHVPVELSAGGTETVVLHIDRMLAEQTTLLQDSPVLATILNEQGLSDAARAALAHVASLRSAVAAREAEQARLSARRTALEQDEERLRKNLAVVAAGDALHGSLVRALAADEAQLTTLAGEAAAAEAALAEARAALQQAVQSLRI
jgi:hypothetical protein